MNITNVNSIGFASKYANISHQIDQIKPKHLSMDSEELIEKFEEPSPDNLKAAYCPNTFSRKPGHTDEEKEYLLKLLGNGPSSNETVIHKIETSSREPGDTDEEKEYLSELLENGPSPNENLRGRIISNFLNNLDDPANADKLVKAHEDFKELVRSGKIAPGLVSEVKYLQMVIIEDFINKIRDAQNTETQS